MRLVRQTRLHFREGNSDKVYEVDLCEVAGGFVVNFRYGRRGAALKENAKTTIPVSQPEAEKIFQKLISEKTSKGYRVVGDESEERAAQPEQTPAAKSTGEETRKQAVLARLRKGDTRQSNKIWNLDRAIWRAGELKIREAVPLLINFIGTGGALRDYCVAWSLGFCGDETALAALSNLYNNPKTPDFVRRIAAEAMLKLAGDERRDLLKANSIEFLPAELRESAKSGSPEMFEKALRENLANQRGNRTVLEQVYAVDNEIVRPALLRLLGEIPLKPGYFKPLRHIFKIAEYRRDAEVFGIIAKRFETDRQQATYTDPMTGETVIVNNDGEKVVFGRGFYRASQNELKKDDSRLAYGRKTREYFRNRTWRTLRRMGEIGDSDYVKMAVGALLPYSDADAEETRIQTFKSYLDENGNWNWRNPRKWTVSWDAFAGYLLFNHILYENSPRYEYKTGTMAFRCKPGYKQGNPAPAFREEAFPALWNRQPVGLLHLLSESNCLPVHEFAVKALRDNKEFCRELDLDAVLMLLERPYEITAKLGFELARERYDAANPNIELVVAVAVCRNEEARAEAFKWIDARRELFARNSSVLVRLLASNHADARAFAANLLRTTNYTETEAQLIIGSLISEMVAFDETKRDAARDLGEAVFKAFARELRRLNLQIVLDLLASPLVEVQELGGNILLNHETPPERLPDELIASLINSRFETTRGIGIKLFGQLPDENLLTRENVILALLAHELVDVHNSTRPIVRRLGEKYAAFSERTTEAIVYALLQSEKHEGVHSRLLGVLKEDLSNWTNFVDEETVRLLVNAESTQAQEAAGIALRANAQNWHEQFTTEEIVNFTNNEVLAVRRASWRLAENAAKRFLASENPEFFEEVSYLVRALDAKWEDSRDFWFEFFSEKLTAEELTPEILVAISDSVKPAVQKFGRDLLLRYFREENGAEYLLKLSEHPSAEMQLFATNYLEAYAAGSPERLSQLAPYFVRVLSLVNRARTAKTRILQFLEREALKNIETAQIVADVFARQSATAAIGDKAATIENMLKIRKAFPEIALPIEVKPKEVRGNVV